MQNRIPWLRLAWVHLLVSVVCMLLATACGGGMYANSYAQDAAMPESNMMRERGEAWAPEESDDGSGAVSDSDEALPPQQMLAAAESGRVASAGGTGSTNPQPQPQPAVSDASPIQQVLIYTATFSMAVFEVEKAIGAVEDLARNAGGFVARRDEHSVTVRVPAVGFDDAVKAIAGMGNVLGRNVQVEDVTEEFLDVTLRLKNARQVRDRVADLLANAKNVEESIKVEQELRRLSTEIERLEGRLKLLSNRARFSTITVTFETVRAAEARTKFRLPFPWLAGLGLGRLMDLR